MAAAKRPDLEVRAPVARTHHWSAGVPRLRLLPKMMKPIFGHESYPPFVNELSPEELHRYGRHVVLPNVGVDGQLRLKESSVLIVGAGGLGSPVALYLAAAGVGRIAIVDRDRVDVTNLQRQILHATSSLGVAKARSASARLEDLNPLITVKALELSIDATNVRALVAAHDLTIDCSDNFPTRYLVNDACVLERKPLVFGSIFRFDGEVTIFPAGGRPCYRCLHPTPPAVGTIPDCEEGGVLGVLPGVIGTLQATEALKLLLGIGRSLTARLLLFDALALRFREIALAANARCALCGDAAILREVQPIDQFCEVNTMNDITPKEVREKQERGETFQLVDVREPHEWSADHIDGAAHIPLGSLTHRVGELDPELPTVVYCKGGGRSARAAAFLREHGFAAVQNMSGGMMRWVADVEPHKRVG